MSSNIETLSFEDSIQELEKIVKELDIGDISLNDAMDNYELGKKIIDHCNTLLKEAELKISNVE